MLNHFINVLIIFFTGYFLYAIILFGQALPCFLCASIYSERKHFHCLTVLLAVLIIDIVFKLLSL